MPFSDGLPLTALIPPRSALTSAFSSLNAHFLLVPPLTNAHDHLELNHYPRTKYRDRYPNAHEWGEDVNQHLTDSDFRRLRAYPLADRLFIGGLKNLLCGALTVVHHNPPHRDVFRKGYPVRVLRRYGWAHSFGFNTDAEIVKAYRRTPRGAFFFIHLAEGTDDRAAGEYQRLKSLGCVASNTVIIHGVGLTPADIADASPRVRALITCPTTNRYLLGASADLDAWKAAGGIVWVGSDSRLTSDGDLLDEINALASPGESAADVLSRLTAPTPLVGRRWGWGPPPPSFLALPPEATIPLRRADLALIVRDGVPQIGDPDVMALFPGIPVVSAVLDGYPKRIHQTLAAQIRRCALQEPGLSLQ